MNLRLLLLKGSHVPIEVGRVVAPQESIFPFLNLLLKRQGYLGMLFRRVV